MFETPGLNGFGYLADVSFEDRDRRFQSFFNVSNCNWNGIGGCGHRFLVVVVVLLPVALFPVGLLPVFLLPVSPFS